MRTFTCDARLWKQLYTLLVRPHLEYASTVWNSYLRGDIKALEKVQERAATRIRIYEDRLKEWDLKTLEERGGGQG